MDGCFGHGSGTDDMDLASMQLWTAETIVVDEHAQLQYRHHRQQPSRRIGSGGGSTCPTGNVTLSVNVSTGRAVQFQKQYLSCRADGQAGHACQAGDDVNIFFFSGPTATNQQWSLRACPTSITHATPPWSSSQLVSAMSGACVSSTGFMVRCNCTDKRQLWSTNVSANTSTSCAFILMNGDDG